MRKTILKRVHTLLNGQKSKILIVLFLICNVIFVQKCSTDKAIKRNEADQYLTGAEFYRDMWMQTVGEYFNFRRRRKSEHFSNKADFAALRHIFDAMNARKDYYCNSKFFVIIGGINQGDLLDLFFNFCAKIHIYGFEIQDDLYKIVNEKYSSVPNVEILNLGLGEIEERGLSVGGEGSKAGLFGPSNASKLVNTVSIELFSNQKKIETVHYVVIDVEGFEPKVIRGMSLQKIENQKRFSMFQFELGNAWAENDERRMNDPWSLQDTVRHLEECGYHLYIIGTKEWIRVSNEFFADGVGLRDDDGLGMYVDGNLLAVHSKYSDKYIYDIVKRSSDAVYKQIQLAKYRLRDNL